MLVSEEHLALHQKSGQYADPSVNKTFLASFRRLFWDQRDLFLLL